MRLDALYPTLTSEERAALAEKLESEAGYLWQLATRWRNKRPSFNFMRKLAEVEPRLTLGELTEEFAVDAEEPQDGA